MVVSAVTGEGVSGLMMEIMEVLKRVAVEGEAGKKVPGKVFRPQPWAGGISVHKEEDTFVVVVPKLERIVAGTGLGSSEVRWQLKRQLVRLGAGKALEKAGIKPGDKVRCGSLELEW